MSCKYIAQTYKWNFRFNVHFTQKDHFFFCIHQKQPEKAYKSKVDTKFDTEIDLIKKAGNI